MLECLTLGLNPGGTKTWSALFYASGKPRYVGRYPVPSLAQARDAARKFLENPQKALGPGQARFKEVSEIFMKRYVEANGLAFGNVEIARTLNKYILPRWGFGNLRHRRSDLSALLDKVEDDHGARQADTMVVGR